MKYGSTFNATRRLIGATALVGAILVGSGQTAGATVSKLDPISPSRVATVAETKCGPAAPGIACKGWDGVDIRTETSLFVVGFENNQGSNQKHVLQTVATFDLGAAKDALVDGKVALASLSFSEASTTHRSAAGDSEYGILPSCNTKLGVPTAPWNGSQNKILQTTDAEINGVVGATVAESGIWDVTPQVTKWLKAGNGQGTFVLRSEDESLTPKAQSMCLSYVMDLSLTIEVAPAE
jgi:hypothetical protein